MTGNFTITVFSFASSSGGIIVPFSTRRQALLITTNAGNSQISNRPMTGAGQGFALTATANRLLIFDRLRHGEIVAGEWYFFNDDLASRNVSIVEAFQDDINA